MYGSVQTDSAPQPRARGQAERDTLLPMDHPAVPFTRRATGRNVMTLLTLGAFLAAIFLVWSADWTPEVNPFRLPDPDGPPRGHKNFTGSQITTRQAFGYGVYVFEVLPNIDKRAVVTSISTFIPRPPPGDYLQLSKLWRMAQIDLQFAPQSLQPQRQFVTCAGPFPHASCNITRSGDADFTDVVAMATEVPGAYTDDTVVRAIVNNIKRFKKEGREEWFNFTNADLAQLKTWGDLVNNTGDGLLFRTPLDWPLPQALCFAWNTTTCVNRTTCLHIDSCKRNQTCATQCPDSQSQEVMAAECNATEPGKGCLTDCNDEVTDFEGREYRLGPNNEWGIAEGHRLDFIRDKRCLSYCPKHTSATNHTTRCTTSCDQMKTIRTHAHCAHYKLCWVNTTERRKNAESTCVRTLPPQHSQTNLLKTTVYRMPAGLDTVEEGGVAAGFLPHDKIDRWDVSGFIMASSGGIYNPTFNPYTYFHTYTLKFSPEGIFFYVNAPGKGFDLSNAKPIFNMSVDDYPDIKMMGPDMPGGNLPWEPLHGPAGFKRQGLGLSQMSVRMFFDEEQGGVVKDFKCTDTFVRRVAYRPLPPDPVVPVDLGNGTLVTPSPEPPHERPGETPFEVDFSKFNTSHWWTRFRETFMIDHDDAGVRSGANVEFGLAPDLSHALILKGCQREQMTNKAVYQLSPGGWAQVIDYKTGDLWAEAMVPRFDLFPLPPSGFLQVWVVVHGGRCGYQLTPTNWRLMPGKGDLLNGTLCSFLQTVNEGTHVFHLPDGSRKLLLTPAPNAVHPGA
eukprot:EG_transcript_2069